MRISEVTLEDHELYWELLLLPQENPAHLTGQTICSKWKIHHEMDACLWHHVAPLCVLYSCQTAALLKGMLDLGRRNN